MISKNEEFIRKANITHKNKYTYSKTLYMNSRTKVIVTCSQHGDFCQTPNHHLSGGGCPSCSGNRKLSTEEFIVKAKELHGDKYGYNDVVYINNSTNVLINCRTHGNFTQRPMHHLSGSGCNKCIIDRNTYSTKEFINSAIKIHGLTYDYSDSVYVTTKLPINIRCIKHGTFSQTPNSHLSGSGCPSCSATGFKDSEPATFYVFEVIDGDSVIALKYGITNNDISVRKWQHEHYSNYKFEIVYQHDYQYGKDARDVETEVKNKFKTPHLSKKKLNLGYTETVDVKNKNILFELIKKGA